jgi:DNA-binding transcriptional MerR regulator
MPLIKLKGKVFGHLRVVGRDTVAGYRACSYWYCMCTCGRKQSVRSSYLRWNIITRCYTCSIKILKRKWKRMNEERMRERMLKPRKRMYFIRGTNGSMVIPIKKKFTPTKMDDQIKEIIFLRSTGTSIKDIAALLEVSVEMTADVLKNKQLFQSSIKKEPTSYRLKVNTSHPHRQLTETLRPSPVVQASEVEPPASSRQSPQLILLLSRLSLRPPSPHQRNQCG